VALVLTRQNVPIYDRESDGLGAADGLTRGGYVFYESGDSPEIVLIATGSEVELAYDAAKTLAVQGIAARVVSLPSWELFAQQDEAYRNQVLPPNLPRLAVEAGAPFGWERWVGNDPARGGIIAIDRFGASAPYKRIFQEFGLTAENIVAHAKKLLSK
jgi:transketolase